MSELGRALSALVAAHAAQDISISFDDLQSGETVELGAAKRMHAASTMKVAVLIAAERLAAAGKLRLDDPVRVQNRFESLADGSPFSVDPKDDSDRWIYSQIGRELPLRTLLERMIVRSSNLATNLVMRRVGAPEVTETSRALGAKDIEILRGVEDARAHEKGLDNTTTAHDLAVLLRAVAEGRTPHSEEVLDLLSRQEENEGIPSALPKGTRVAHKPGSITRHYHDAALVFPPGRKPYVLVILTRGFNDEATAISLVHQISTLTWHHVREH